MQIKIENNKVIVAQKINTDLSEFREATSIEEDVINQGILAQIEGAIYDPTVNLDYQTELKQQKETWFKFNFFRTTIGWIRRKPVMADGSIKDFLSDVLPIIKIALTSAGLPAGAIIRYSEPDYSNELTTEYMKTLQNNSALTLEQANTFIVECITRYLADFKGS